MTPAAAVSWLKFAHVINPFRSPAGHQHDVAQRVTLHSMSVASEAARAAGLSVTCVGAVYPDDADVVPPWMTAVPTLSRSVNDLGTFQKRRRVPPLADVIAAAVAAVPDATHVIVSNLDIALQPEFYLHAAGVVTACGGRVPAFTVTRRVISADYRDVADYDRMCADPGIGHPGFDCFVFPADYVPHLRLADVCTGLFWFDMLLLANLDAVSGHRLLVLKDQHWTFHIGDDASWFGVRDEFSDFNRGQCELALRQLKRDGRYWPVASWEGWLAAKLRRPDGRPVVAKGTVVARERLRSRWLRRTCGFGLT